MMAGHSKWANIKHAKAGQDAKRGKIFTKLIREITIASRLGGADPTSNPRLRTAVDKALSHNMPKDTVQRAIKRGAGDEDTSQWVETRYEGYGPGGVAVLVEGLTDNKNRTVAEVRYAFSKCSGHLGTDGAVAYLFKKIGLITCAPGAREEKIMELALASNAEDVAVQEDGSIDITTTPETLEAVCQAMKTNNLDYAQAEVTMLATTEISLNQEQAEQMTRLIDLLEDLDDVQNVYSNARYPN